MSEVKRYHVTEAGLVEGQALGRINVVLGPDYDSAVQCFLTAAEGCVAAERRERALQALLTAADERADTATSLIQRIVANFDTEIEFHEDVEPNDLEHDQVMAEMRVFLAALKPAESSGKPCACPGCDSPRRANSPFCVSHRSAKNRTRGQDPLTAEGLEWLMQNDGLQQ
ncbi:hypothetical protein JFT44_12295 [Pseudomonas sp. MF5691]|uniref:hypothetical protein n=1 Tax=Pseudomonas sp. MF5691 TaxID=2797526 RepID=UPI0018E8E8E8|nr:hypothetical protein [Pseudomonas sp. MF5691]MBJ2290715.1 hypothetical protein [Pseudomonas sp. MF5691]